VSAIGVTPVVVYKKVTYHNSKSVRASLPRTYMYGTYIYNSSKETRFSLITVTEKNRKMIIQGSWRRESHFWVINQKED